MSEQTAEQTIEQQQATQPQAGQQAAAQQPEATPPWGSEGEFNPEKAWSLIQGLKADKEKLSAREVLTDDAKTKLAEYDRMVEASKTDLEVAQEAAGKVPTLEAQNLRLQVALEKGLTGDRAGLIARLQGETREELTADADQLLSMFAAPAGPETQSTVTSPKPNPAQGASAGGTPSPAQEAAQAAASGNWRESIRLKSQQLVQARELAD